MLSINVIGAGRLGKTLSKLFIKHQVGKIQAVCNQSMTSSRLAIDYLREGQAYCDILNLPSADITLIATPDDQIEVVARRLVQSNYLKPHSLVFHCSGSLSSLILTALTEKKCLIASAHPMHSFADPALSIQSFEGTYCALEGDPAAFIILKDMFTQIGSITYEVATHKKNLYHAAGVIASNYLVTLCEQAMQCMKEAGVEALLAMNVITHLMLGTVQNLINTQSTMRSLTGPIKRGDCETLSKHIASLPSQQQKAFYCNMGLLTLDIANHTADIQELIKTKLKWQ